MSRFLPAGYMRELRHGALRNRQRTARWFADARLARWRRRTLDPFVWGERERLFLAIARYWLLHSAPAVATKHTRSDARGYYFEFGSYGARTMRLAFDTFRHAFDWTYVAFDSFAGLPDVPEEETQGGIWRGGLLSMSEEKFLRVCLRHGMPRDRLRTVKGFYDQSLTEELRHELLPDPCMVAYIDCDLYRSTVPVLEFLVPFLRAGSVIVFDDWFLYHGNPREGERLAFEEFRTRHPDLHFEPLIASAESQVFVLSGRTSQRHDPGVTAASTGSADASSAGHDPLVPVRKA